MIKIHKVNKYLEALCRTRFMGWVIPEADKRSYNWNKINCKNCLKKRKQKVN